MIEQGSKEWFKQRIGKLTGSRVGAILGQSKYQTRESILRLMVREYLDHTGVELCHSEFQGNVATEWGNEHEIDAIVAYEIETGNHVESAGLVQHPELPYLASSPDGLVGEKGCIEAKCPYSKKLFSIHDRPDYMAQAQCVMHCCEREWCDFIVWIPGEPLQIERVEIDHDWLENLLPDFDDFYAEYLAVINDESKWQPFIDPLVMERNDSDWQKLADAYIAATKTFKAAKKAQEEARKALIESANDSSSQGHGVQVLKVHKKGRVQYSKIPELEAVDLEQYRSDDSDYWMVR